MAPHHPTVILALIPQRLCGSVSGFLFGPEHANVENFVVFSDNGIVLNLGFPQGIPVVEALPQMGIM
jgi:hypothetical protein